MAKYYLATSLQQFEKHNLLRDLLKEQGHEVTYDWTLHHSVGVEDYRLVSKEAQRVASMETQGVIDADILVVLLPGGRGTHTELGLGLASGKPILIHSEDEKAFSLDHQRCVFYHHPLVSRVACPLDDLQPLLEAFSRLVGLHFPAQTGVQ